MKLLAVLMSFPLLTYQQGTKEQVLLVEAKWKDPLLFLVDNYFNKTTYLADHNLVMNSPKEVLLKQLDKMKIGDFYTSLKTIIPNLKTDLHKISIDTIKQQLNDEKLMVMIKKLQSPKFLTEFSDIMNLMKEFNINEILIGWAVILGRDIQKYMLTGTFNEDNFQNAGQILQNSILVKDVNELLKAPNFKHNDVISFLLNSDDIQNVKLTPEITAIWLKKILIKHTDFINKDVLLNISKNVSTYATTISDDLYYTSNIDVSTNLQKYFYFTINDKEVQLFSDSKLHGTFLSINRKTVPQLVNIAYKKPTLEDCRAISHVEPDIWTSVIVTDDSIVSPTNSTILTGSPVICKDIIVGSVNSKGEFKRSYFICKYWIFCS
ncbi:uncharacterized protein LOC126265281 [Aethina tumida]|uniref:uncharacterized protein LOC126265281 n=1 Tax=Aethina tumida TaxID=116153 RepID=UPI0021483526|nr:uncharacterized protein LOC126265281 [Aethina tumida]